MGSGSHMKSAQNFQSTIQNLHTRIHDMSIWNLLSLIVWLGAWCRCAPWTIRQYSSLFQICISTIYPVLAFLLFFEIREAAKRAKRLSLQKFSDQYCHLITYHLIFSFSSQTSRLVLILTVSFVISSTPLGICYFLQTSVTLSSLGVMIVGYGTIFCSCLFTINASTHAIICLTLSSEYRKTVRKVLRIAEKEVGFLGWDIDLKTNFHFQITTDKIFTSRLD